MKARDDPVGKGQGRLWRCLDLPCMDYGHAWDLQRLLVEARKMKRVPDVVLLLEHPPVFTLGRRGGREHLRVPEERLARQGIALYHVERGGQITYHGPGQLIGYFIVDLRANGWKVVDFVEALEEVMIRTVARWGVRAGRNPLNRGIWVESSKLGSIGLAVRRGVTFHGFALNVCTSMEPFQWIDPCGLKGVRMTSLQSHVKGTICLESVRKAAKEEIEGVFGVRLEPWTLKALRASLQEVSE